MGAPGPSHLGTGEWESYSRLRIHSLITDVLAFHPLREHSNRRRFGLRGASLPGPQKRGTGGTLSVVWNGHRDRGHPPS